MFSLLISVRKVFFNPFIFYKKYTDNIFSKFEPRKKRYWFKTLEIIFKRSFLNNQSLL